MVTTDTTDPFARLPNESFVEYLKRIKNVRGMLLGQYAQTEDPVDEALTEEIASQQPLGQEIVRDSGGDGDGGPIDTRTPEERKRDRMERAVGLLSGTAASAVGLGLGAGPFGAALGAFADYDTVRQFENELASQGFTEQQIEDIKANPEALQRGLQTGVFGVKSEGYQPTLVDKFSITGLFSDVFKDRSQPYSLPSAYPNVSSMLVPGYSQVTQPAPLYYGMGQPPQAGMLQRQTTSNLAPQNTIIGTQAFGGNVVGLTSGGVLIDRTGDGVADVRTGVSPNTGQVNTYNFNLDQRNDGPSNNYGGGAETGAAESAAGGGYSSDPTGYSGSF